jgi:hypothetical protein
MENTPKTQMDFNNQYAQLCAEIGDKLLAIENLNAAIIEVKKKIVALSEEAKIALAPKSEEAKAE